MTISRPLANPLHSPLARALTDAGSGGGFSPLSLYAASQDGLWYAPNDFTAQFQDSAGTLPLTAVEQPDGLSLDKRLGLVRGAELVTNGTFDTSSGWTLGTWNVSGATLNSTGAGGATGDATYAGGAVAATGVWHEVAFTIVSRTSTQIYISLGVAGSYIPLPAGTGSFNMRIQSSGANGILYFRKGDTSASVSLDNVSIREIPGNHATQATAAARPVVSARKNLLLKTEQLDDANWNNAAGITRVPVGNGVFKLVESALNETHFLRHTVALPAGSMPRTLSIEVKAAERTLFRLDHAGLSVKTLTLDLLTGIPTLIGSDVTNTFAVTPLSDGWFRISVGVAYSGNIDMRCGPVVSGTTYSHAGDGVSGVYVRYPQAEIGLIATRYQRVNTATDYDTAGFPHYWKFDGVDDGLLTAPFAAGTLGTDMDCFMLVRRDTAGNAVLGYTTTADATKLFGVITSGSATLSYDGAGAPSHAVNGVVVGSTRGDLDTALPVGRWCVLEVRNLNLSTWTALGFGAFSAFSLNGGIGGVILCPAQSASKRTEIRQYLAAQVGITLP